MRCRLVREEGDTLLWVVVQVATGFDPGDMVM